MPHTSTLVSGKFSAAGDSPWGLTAETVHVSTSSSNIRHHLSTQVTRMSAFEVVGSSTHFDDAVRAIERTNPSVAVIDLALSTHSPQSALTLCNALAHSVSAPGIVMWSARADDTLVAAAVYAGAHAYISGPAGFDEFDRAVRAAARHESAFDPVSALAIVRATTRPGRPQALLTDRELGLLPLIAQGMSRQQVADTVGIAYNTVRFHFVNLSRKLGVHGRLQLVDAACSIIWRPDFR